MTFINDSSPYSLENNEDFENFRKIFLPLYFPVYHSATGEKPEVLVIGANPGIDDEINGKEIELFSNIPNRDEVLETYYIHLYGSFKKLKSKLESKFHSIFEKIDVKALEDLHEKLNKTKMCEAIRKIYGENVKFALQNLIPFHSGKWPFNLYSLKGSPRAKMVSIIENGFKHRMRLLEPALKEGAIKCVHLTGRGVYKDAFVQWNKKIYLKYKIVFPPSWIKIKEMSEKKIHLKDDTEKTMYYGKLIIKSGAVTSGKLDFVLTDHLSYSKSTQIAKRIKALDISSFNDILKKK
ncbi:MAG: hypothetical protein ACTSVI_11455 [Promethearchaeota archaeon]